MPGAFEPAGGTDVAPDLITFAKGVNSGYVPLGGVIISDAVANTFRQRAFPGGLTYSGHPLGCAAAVANIGVMTDERLIENADRLGRSVIGPLLTELAASSPIVGEVRGAGCFWAVELVTDQGTREVMPPERMALLAGACRARGLVPFINGGRTHVVPALNITDEEARYGIGLLSQALAEVEASL